jgi:DNA-binding CsgD family transcriptional regulator
MRSLSERQIRWILVGVGAGSFVILRLLDLWTDTDAFSLPAFLIDTVQLLLLITSAVGVGLLVQRMQKQHEEKMTLIRDLEVARADGADWRAKVRANLEGIKAEMERQFAQWDMTPAERDVGLLILKGLSHKEIATIRGTSETTVRQQAQSIYRKSDLPGKTAFSAYFLEDLFTPDVPAHRPGMVEAITPGH